LAATRRGVAINATPQLREQRTAPDRFMRGLLRVGSVVDKNAIFGARRSTTTAVVISGVRCMITYLLIPFLAPFVGLLDAFSVPITVALSVFAIVMGISGLRRFWIADHRARWSYTVFIGVVLVLLSVGIVFDLSTLLPV
jgi:hypothetical protein